MKKIISLFLMSVMLFSMLSVFSSCAFKPESAEALWEKMNEEMNKVDSYKVETEVDMTFYVSKKEMKGKAEGEEIYIGLSKGELYFYCEVETKVKCKELSVDQEVETLTAYVDGNWFLQNDGDAGERKIYSPVTEEKARELITKNSSNIIKAEECEKFEFSERKSKGWVLTCSEYSDKAIEEFSKEFDLGEDILTKPVLDVNVAVEVNKKCLVERVTLEFIFDVEENTVRVPSVKIIAEYSEYNKAKRSDDAPDTSDFAKVEDIAVLYEIEEFFETYKESESGSFTSFMEQTSKLGSSTSRYAEKDEVTYGKNEKGYFYEISANSSNGDYKISYSDGKQSVIGNGNVSSNEQTEEEAKEFIYGLANIAGYSMMYVTDIEKVDGVTYKLISDKADPTKFTPTYTSAKGAITSIKQEMTVTIQDGKVTYIKSVTNVEGTAKSNNTNIKLNIDLTASCTFK